MDASRLADARLAPEEPQEVAVSDLLNGASAALVGSAPGAAANGTTALQFNGSSPQGSVAGAAQAQAGGLPAGARQGNPEPRVAGSGREAPGGVDNGQGTSTGLPTDGVQGALSTRANGKTPTTLRPRFFSPAHARLAASLGTFSFPTDAAGEQLPATRIPGESLPAVFELPRELLSLVHFWRHMPSSTTTACFAICRG